MPGELPPEGPALTERLEQPMEKQKATEGETGRRRDGETERQRERQKETESWIIKV